MNCDFCGGLRMNGAPIKALDDGTWVFTDGGDPDARFACRKCAVERIE